MALSNLGWQHLRLGEYELAAACCLEALPVLELHDKTRTQACVWDTLGRVHDSRGEHRQAVECFDRARSGRPLRAAVASAAVGVLMGLGAAVAGATPAAAAGGGIRWTPASVFRPRAVER